ncbi:MAG: ATP-dependent DNA ligase [Candidatus Korarchaeota archaeon]|nr:ATP-dependent DNA ligase [Thermoproteota archaeon]
MLFKEFAELCDNLAKTPERSRKIRILAEVLRRLEANYIRPFVLLMIGHFAPESAQKQLDISWGTVSHVITNIFSVSKKELVDQIKAHGDLGEAVRAIAERKKLKKQLTLTELTSQDLSIADIYNFLSQMVEIKGTDARVKKESILSTLISRMSPNELKYFIKIIFSDMRHGISVGVMEEAIAKASAIPVELISRAHMILGDIGEVAEKALIEGYWAIKEVKIIPFRPVRPLLAQKAEDVAEALKEHNWETAFEYKFDGLRAQIHKRGDDIRIFSRRLKDVTDSFPEVVELISKNINAREAVLEGEIVGIIDNKPLPFQILMRRVRRLDEASKYRRLIPVDIYLFDILYLDGEMLIDKPYEERRRILEKIANGIKLAPRLITKDQEEAQKFLERAISEGHEGLIAKKLDSKYEPGVRGKSWLKIKRSLEPLDCVIIAAEWGYGRRKKWLSDYYLAVKDEKTSEWAIIGKTFKGLTDEEFEEMTKELLKARIYESGRIVYVKPKVVVEVIYDEIQRSPKYKSGFALRFARINKIRWDKSPEDADTLEEVKRIYREQFKRKAKLRLD